MWDLQVGYADRVVFNTKKLYTNTWHLSISQASEWKKDVVLYNKLINLVKGSGKDRNEP